MMEVMVHDVADLFGGCEVARDQTGSLISIATLLEDCDPVLLLLADADGNVIVAERIAAEAGQQEPGHLAVKLGEGLLDRDTCVLKVPFDDELRLAFAIRLSGRAERGILGGLVRRCEAFEKRLPEMRNAIAVCGELAWTAIHDGLSKTALQTRVQHLVDEQDTLRASHTRAISSAIEEREGRLREQQEHTSRIQAVMMMAADGIVTIDEHGIVDTFNEAAGWIFGYPPEEVVGRNVSMLMPPPHGERHDEYLAEYLSIGHTGFFDYGREVTGLRKDGTAVLLELAVSEVVLGERRIFTGIIRDITERKKAEEELKHLHLQNKMILNSAGEGIFGLDGEGKISFVNPAGAGMLGWEAEELVGKLEHQVFHHTKRNGQPYAVEECPIHRTLRDGTVGVVDSEVFWRKNGSSFPVEYTSTPIRENLEIVGAVLTFRDTTERRALERQLSQAQKLESIGQLAAGVAHEINTPTQYIGDNTRFLQDALRDLNTVLSGFDRLLNAAKNHAVTDDLVAEVEATVDEADVDYLAEEMPKAVEQSLEGVGRVAAIVRSMKEFSHPGSDEKQAVDLSRALENTLTVSRNEWKYVAESVTEFDPTLPQVNCLPGECNQVFLNLIINATHAIADKLGNESTERGTITVSTRHDGDWAEIRVQDNGTGIPEDARCKVLDPFFTTKEVGRGTGQGLAIAHSVIVDKHGGTLAFETETGKGTTFIIRLPVGQESPPAEDVEDEEDLVCR